jgi:hypothetical protein
MAQLFGGSMRLPQPTHLNYSGLVNDIERGTIKIPQFQRDFVWSVERSAKLIDSLLKGYQFPIIEVRDVAIDVATEIFTRINVGGKPLTLFEIMVAKTYDEAKGFDLSQEFDNLVERLQQIDYETISDAVMLQLVALILKRDCRRQVILTLRREEFVDVWPKAVAAVEAASDYFRNTYRIPVSRLLPYNALLVPFAYYFYHHSDKPDREAFSRLQDFFWRCSLGARYSVSVESKLAQDILRIDRILSGTTPDYDWGVNPSPEFIIANGWFGTSRAFVKAILCLLAYQEPRSFNDGATVRISNDWLKQANSRNYHHFFPRAWLRDHGVSEDQANNVVNITIVDEYLNKRRIGARPPSRYMAEFAGENNDFDNTMRTHLIDPNAFGIADDRYNEFLSARASWILEPATQRPHGAGAAPPPGPGR